jgi:hypothetical protein
MPAAIRWLKWRIRTHRMRDRVAEVAREISSELSTRVDLQPLKTGGGQDLCYQARNTAGEIIAMLRISTPDKKPAVIGAGHLRMSLPLAERMNREWNCYHRLSKLGLAPRPLWRDGRAMCCEYLPLPRMSKLLKSRPDQFATCIELVLPRIRQLHDLGLLHLDANLKNVLVDASAGRVAFIDFEYGPAPQAGDLQLRAYDFMKFTHACYRTAPGRRWMDAHSDQWTELMLAHVGEQTRMANMDFVARGFPALLQSVTMVRALTSIFPRLEPHVGIRTARKPFPGLWRRAAG